MGWSLRHSQRSNACDQPHVCEQTLTHRPGGTAQARLGPLRRRRHAVTFSHASAVSALSEVLTVVAGAPVHKELAPRGREPVAISRCRGSAGRGGGEIRPIHSSGVVDVQVLESRCTAEGGVSGACGWIR